MSKLLPLMLAPVLLAGCIRLSPEPPPSLLTLVPATPVAVGQAQQAAGGRGITIAVPSVPQEIATLRVPVRSTPTTVAYIKDARWIEPVNRQFARLLSDTMTARTGRIVVGERLAMGTATASLTGELRSFGADAATNEAVVTFDAALIRAEDAPLEKRRFEARVPVTAIASVPVGNALNQAANQVAGEVADWVGR